MKIRVLYPTAVEGHTGKPVQAGATVELSDGVAKGLIEEGFAEKTDAKAVESATAAPGEKRKAGRPRKRS